MGRIKNFIVKSMGGHTKEEWDNFMAVCCRQQVQAVATYDLDTIRAAVEADRNLWFGLPNDLREKRIKQQISNALANELDKYVEYTVMKPEHPYGNFIVSAKLTVLLPKVGGVLIRKSDEAGR